jgi:hypothetical protein
MYRAKAKFLARIVAAAFAFVPFSSPMASDLGVYVGTNAADVGQFEKWLGCPVQQVLSYTDRRNWADISHPEWVTARFAKLNRPVLWSLSMIPTGATLDMAATGIYDSYYVSAARVLARTRPDAQGIIRIRPGWELNGDWFLWAAEGHEAAYVATFRHIVDSFRSVSSRFRFDWNLSYGRPMDPAKAYPGDKYVDVMSMDFYWRPKFLGNDPVAAFATIRDGSYGLTYLQKFAAAHHKPVAFPEWGVETDNAKPFIDLVSAWIKKYGIIYHNYWNSDSEMPGRLSGGQWPNSGAAFRQDFCPAAVGHESSGTTKPGSSSP